MTARMARARVHRFTHDGLTFEVLDEGPLDGTGLTGWREVPSHHETPSRPYRG